MKENYDTLRFNTALQKYYEAEAALLAMIDILFTQKIITEGTAVFLRKKVDDLQQWKNEMEISLRTSPSSSKLVEENTK